VSLHCRERGELLSLIWNDHAAVLAGLVDKLEWLWVRPAGYCPPRQQHAIYSKNALDKCDTQYMQ